MSKKGDSHKLKTTVEVGAGIATIAALAGAYFLYGKDATKNRQKVTSWTLKVKAEVLEGLENLKEFSEPTYHRVVDEVSKRYHKLPHVDKKELAVLTQELKGHWQEIKKHKLLQKPN